MISSKINLVMYFYAINNIKKLILKIPKGKRGIIEYSSTNAHEVGEFTNFAVPLPNASLFL